MHSQPPLGKRSWHWRSSDSNTAVPCERSVNSSLLTWIQESILSPVPQVCCQVQARRTWCRIWSLSRIRGLELKRSQLLMEKKRVWLESGYQMRTFLHNYSLGPLCAAWTPTSTCIQCPSQTMSWEYNPAFQQLCPIMNILIVYIWLPQF